MGTSERHSPPLASRFFLLCLRVYTSSGKSHGTALHPTSRCIEISSLGAANVPRARECVLLRRNKTNQEEKKKYLHELARTTGLVDMIRTFARNVCRISTKLITHVVDNNEGGQNTFSLCILCTIPIYWLIIFFFTFINIDNNFIYFKLISYYRYN